jgi:hypothetical protein
LDDVLGFAHDFSSCLQLLKDTITTLMKANVLLNFEKSTLIGNWVIWCGRHVSGKGVTFNPKAIEPFLSIPPPVSGEDLTKFIHGVNFFRPILMDFARIALPIYEELNRLSIQTGSRKNKRLSSTKVIWTTILKKSFEDTKELIKEPLTLGFPAESDDVFLITDASDYGFAAIATSTRPDPIVHFTKRVHTPVGMVSGTFTEQQRRWTTIDKEFWPLVLASEKLRTILHRERGFTYVTDSMTLKSFLEGSVALELKRPIGDKLLRWKTRLHPFNFTAVHLKGTSNLFADMVSRLIGASTVAEIEEEELPFV